MQQICVTKNENCPSYATVGINVIKLQHILWLGKMLMKSIKHVLLAEAQSRRLLGALVLLSHMMSHKIHKKEKQEKTLCPG